MTHKIALYTMLPCVFLNIILRCLLQPTTFVSGYRMLRMNTAKFQSYHRCSASVSAVYVIFKSWRFFVRLYG
ncbi:hypothetical protein BDR07DRAFT_1390890 [Suillus spraguei]|nr:hypothetical protein BDR07DRAFT_1390890 [Suillus spraguei]